MMTKEQRKVLDDAEAALKALKLAMKPVCRHHGFLNRQYDKANDKDPKDPSLDKVQRDIVRLERLMDRVAEYGERMGRFGITNPSI